MIIVDYSGIAIATIFVQGLQKDISESLLRHMILNSLRMYNKKYKAEYGEMVIACDHSSWRKQVFPYYKAKRAKGRAESPLDWNQLFDWLTKIRDEIEQYTPYKVMHVEGAEADDIIGVLTRVAQDQFFGHENKIMIISADHDFIQLQKYSGVKQFSPSQKKLVTVKDPNRYLFEHICRGDVGDGVPNIFSDDDTFVSYKRQNPASKKKIDACYKLYVQQRPMFTNHEQQRNFERNKLLIDLSQQPQVLVDRIVAEYEKQKSKEKPGANALMTYFIKNKLNKLLAVVPEFL